MWHRTKILLLLVSTLIMLLWLLSTFLPENNEIMEQHANTPMGQIELERIPQEEIRGFIREQIKNDVISFDKLTSTYNPGDSLSGYRYHEEVYHFDYPREQLWKHYLAANPGDAWDGDMITFGLMVSKQKQEVMYIGDAYHGAAEGQVLFINIEVLGGLLKVPVAHEIIKINPEKNYFEISYLEGGKSAGMQRITFYENQDGTTRILHYTYYRSASDFRDTYIYPYFHTKAINEYHQNMISALNAGNERM